jgi:hypothetical protein
MEIRKSEMPLERGREPKHSHLAATRPTSIGHASVPSARGCGGDSVTFHPVLANPRLSPEVCLINVSDYFESALQRLHLQLNSQNGADIKRKSNHFFSIVRKHRHHIRWRVDFNGYPTVRKAQRHHQQCAAEN